MIDARSVKREWRVRLFCQATSVVVGLVQKPERNALVVNNKQLVVPRFILLLISYCSDIAEEKDTAAVENSTVSKSLIVTCMVTAYITTNGYFFCERSGMSVKTSCKPFPKHMEQENKNNQERQCGS